MIVLASGSPRRRELLGLITPRFEVVPSDVDEAASLTDPGAVALELARRKAAAVSKEYPRDLVIGCDTLVWRAGKILGKPRDGADAERMIRFLQGETHAVYTGVAMRRGDEEIAEVSVTEVEFAPMSEEEIETYLRDGDVMDKAGAYAVQGAAAKFVRRVDGSFTGVVGLPVELVYRMLKKMGESAPETSFRADAPGAAL